MKNAKLSPDDECCKNDKGTKEVTNDIFNASNDGSSVKDGKVQIEDGIDSLSGIILESIYPEFHKTIIVFNKFLINGETL